MVLVRLGVLALLLGPPVSGDASPSDAAARDDVVGLELGPGIGAADRGPIERGFTRTLALACPRTRPCVRECEADEPRVGVRLDGESREYTLAWTAEDPRLEHPLELDSRCELCSLVELEQQLATDLGRLCAQLDALDAGPGQLELSSDPTHARVQIDGEAIGRTPWTGELAAGEHTLEVSARGHRSVRRRLTIEASVTRYEHVALTPTTGPRAGHRPTWPAWASLGLGLTASVAGAALIGANGRPWARRCSGTDVDVAGNCRFVLTTRPLGIGLAAVGVAALGSGVGLMIWAQRDHTHTCAGIQVGGRF